MTTNTLLILLIIGTAGIIVFLTQLYIHFSRSARSQDAAISERLKEINQNLLNHLASSSKLILDANRNMGVRLENATTVVGDVREKLGRLEETSRQIYEIGKDIASLQDIFRAPKARGGIGEYMLEDMLKDMIPREHYATQYEFKNKEKVDAIVRFKDGIVPIDAKFPLENFKKLLESKEDKERAAIKKVFIQDVKNHIKKISEKYIVQDEGTFDFALMYIPAENVYYETIIRDESADNNSGLLEYARSKKVIPVSPNSFYAYLQVILIGLKGLAVEKSAKDIIFNLSKLKIEFERFSDDFGKMGRHMDNAKSSYNETEKRLVRISDRLSSIELKESPEIKAMET